MTKTIAIRRHNGRLVINTEDWPSNLPADRMQVVVLDKYGSGTALALTDSEVAQLRDALNNHLNSNT